MGNEIIVFDENHESLKGFSDREKSIVMAKKSDLIRESESNEINEMVVNTLQRTYFEFGRSKPKTEDEAIARRKDDGATAMVLIQDIKRDFKSFSFEDISIAFSMGVRGEFGKFHGLNVRTFYGWLKSYKSLKVKTIQSHSKKMLQLNAAQEPKHKPHGTRSIEELQPAYDLVMEYAMEHDDIPKIADWLSVYWFIEKSGDFDLKSNERKEKFKRFHQKYLVAIGRKKFGKEKKVEEILKSFTIDQTYKNGQRQCYAKFHFLEIIKSNGDTLAK